MSTRYVVEKVAKQPTMRRIKDTERNRYVKQPHGDELWLWPAAQNRAEALNAPHAGRRDDSSASVGRTAPDPFKY